MKTLALSLLILAASSALAEPPAVTATALSLTGEPAKKALAEFHVFAGTPALVDLAVEAPLGSKLEFVADVLQVTQGLAAPLSTGVSLGETADFSRQTRQILHVAIPLPEVKRITELRVRVKTPPAAEIPVALVGEFRLFVYPPDDLQELREVFGENTTAPSLSVFGPGNALREFFTAAKIPFADRGTEIPDEFQPGVLYIGVAESAKIAERLSAARQASILFFSPGGIPGVYRSAGPEGTVTKVTLPLLEHLSTNPLSRKTFSELLRQSATNR